jgi:hypothetical protein
MKAATLPLCFLICAGALRAQFTAVLNQAGNRPPEVEIRNDAAVAMTAFAIRMDPAAGTGEAHQAPFVAFADAAVDPAPMPLLTNQKYGVAVPSRYRQGQAPQALYVAPIVSAAVFADGTTTGDASLLARLILRRCNMLQAVELAQDMLSAAGRHNMPRAQLTAEFQRMADSLNHWYLPPEQQVGQTVYQTIVGKLLGLPDLPFGAPFPPAPFVQEEVAALSRRRTTLLEARPELSVAITRP